MTCCYNSVPYFASVECGAYYIYKITGVDYTRHLIDSLAVTDSVINNVDMERIQVFFRTIEPDEPSGDDDDDSSSENGEEAES